MASIKESFKGEIALRQRMRDDFPFYAEILLKILPKSGGVHPFKLNRAQLYIHKALEEQKTRIGRVRALALKARQMGCSTLIAGRFFHQVNHRIGINAHIHSHAQDTTDKLFLMTHNFQLKMDPKFKQATRAASAKELAFSKLDTSYYVGTAGAKEGGRGGTIQYFHGSEVAFWPSPEKQFGGVMQSIPTGTDADGTEIILESTANGPTGIYYEMCMDARKNKGEYMLIFTPWFWQDTYRTEPPVDWDWRQQDDYEQNRVSVEKYKLDVDQIYWMHLKRIELRWDWLFKQEYPAEIDEAFQTQGEDSLIPVEDITDAIEPKDNLPWNDTDMRIGALDPAGASGNADRTGLGHRQGRIFEHIEYFKGKTAPELVQYTKDYIDKWKLDRLYVDTQGLGGPIYDFLRDSQYKSVIRPCSFASSAVDVDALGNPKYFRKRDECWGRTKDWFADKPVEIPNIAELRADLVAPGYRVDNGKLKLESKREMRKRGIESPDGGDVLAMTFTDKTPKKLPKWQKSAKVVPDYDIMRLGL